MTDFVDQLAALDHSISERIKRVRLDQKIEARTRELFGADGANCGYSREQAREQATREVMSESARENANGGRYEDPRVSG